jgi:hypothetical protein
MRAAAILVVVLLSGCFAESLGHSRLPDNAPYLLADRYPVLRIAVRHVEGWVPSAEALQGVHDEVLRATGRDSVQVDASQVLAGFSAGPDGIWSERELDALRDHVKPQDASTIVLLFLDGGVAVRDDVTAFGLARGAFAMVFPQEFATQVTIGGFGIPRLNRAEIERAVAIHEVGHVLGLVALGVPRSHGPRSDDACKCHSGDPDSVMYKEADTDVNPAFVAGVESSEISYRFTDDDVADIRAFQLEYGFQPGL